MRRLTWRFEDGSIGIPGLDRAEALHRLGEIEDILGQEYDLDHLRELVETERDGRLVTLLCKVGDTVYHIDLLTKQIEPWKTSCLLMDYTKDPFQPNREIPLKFFMDLLQEGQELFLTREEAEVALKEAER